MKLLHEWLKEWDFLTGRLADLGAIGIHIAGHTARGLAGVYADLVRLAAFPR